MLVVVVVVVVLWTYPGLHIPLQASNSRAPPHVAAVVAVRGSAVAGSLVCRVVWEVKGSVDRQRTTREDGTGRRDTAEDDLGSPG